jgi:hypothetical protein
MIAMQTSHIQRRRRRRKDLSSPPDIAFAPVSPKVAPMRSSLHRITGDTGAPRLVQRLRNGFCNAKVPTMSES